MSFLSNVIRARLQTAAQRMEQNTISILRGKLSSWGLSIPIGCLGPVVFTVSSSEVRTFSDWKREAKGRYATHNVMGGRPVLEFLGTDLQTITFTMRLSVFLGVNPANEAAKLRQLCEDGTSMPLVIGNETVGNHAIKKWQRHNFFTDFGRNTFLCFAALWHKPSILWL